MRIYWIIIFVCLFGMSVLSFMSLIGHIGSRPVQLVDTIKFSEFLFSMESFERTSPHIKYVQQFSDDVETLSWPSMQFYDERYMQNRTWLWMDTDGVYLRVRCYVQYDSHDFAQAKLTAESPWKNDSLELFFQGDSDYYIQIVMSINGQVQTLVNQFITTYSYRVLDESIDIDTYSSFRILSNGIQFETRILLKHIPNFDFDHFKFQAAYNYMGQQEDVSMLLQQFPTGIFNNHLNFQHIKVVY